MNNTRKDIRLVVMITPKMDDDLEMMADLQGLCKSDVVRFAVSQYVSNYKMAVQFAKDKILDLTDEDIVKLKALTEKHEK